MPNLEDEFRERIATGLVTNTLTSCSRWANKRRIMGGSKPGPYSTDKHPWCKEMMDSGAPFNYSMKGAQLGVTEVAINRALYTIDRLRRDVLYVLPTSSVAQDFSRARFKTALTLSPYLQSIFTDTNTVGLKQAGSTNLYIRGSRGESNLVSIPASVLVLDEVDRMDQEVIWLALERLSGQFGRKEVWGISTPTIPNYGIHKLFSGSTQEHLHFPCPSCGRLTYLVWPDCVEVVGEHPTDPRCAESYLKCKECKARLPHEMKDEWLANGVWVPARQDANPEVRGFHVNQMYSLTINPGELAVAFLRGDGDEMAAKEFHNSKLGQPFIGDGAKIDETMIARCLGKHSKEDARPAFAGKMYTMGVDQGKWGYITIAEWTYDRVVPDLNNHAFKKIVWQGKFYETEWNRLDELMAEWQIMGCVIDADPEIQAARQFARRYPGFVWLCRYRKGVTAKEISVADDEQGSPLATVDRSNWLSTTLGRYKKKTPTVSLPRDVSQEFMDHLGNVVATYERDDENNPKLVYISTGADHFVHADTYAEIALPLAATRFTNQDITAAT